MRSFKLKKNYKHHPRSNSYSASTYNVHYIISKQIKSLSTLCN